MEKEPVECQAVGCWQKSVDSNGLFCAMHWDMIPADAKALIINLYNADPTTAQHKKWVREVRKTVAMIMAKEKGLKRNANGKNLDQFPAGDPFIDGGKRKAASQGKVLRGPDDRPIQADQNAEESEEGPAGPASN